ncbi:hypothetical protein F4604DRAFT_1673374 [Suillus subluteus]|nr:hypothetical protein F4604DRAFT_1673374 [Suillus subluteus]
MLKKGADAARGDDTSSLKELVATWVNQEFHSSPLIKPNDKHLRSFALMLAQCQVNRNDLKEGFLKSKLLVLAFKAIFTSPSSAREAEGDGYGADILENSRCIWQKSEQTKVKTCVASIINMKKVTPHAIVYVVRFALSSVTSWHTVDGDFDYEAFWSNTVDFFENVPGPVTKRKVDKLLKWWTRKIFGTNHHDDLTPNVVCQMSVNALAEQRKKLEDAAFDSE